MKSRFEEVANELPTFKEMVAGIDIWERHLLGECEPAKCGFCPEPEQIELPLSTAEAQTGTVLNLVEKYHGR